MGYFGFYGFYWAFLGFIGLFWVLLNFLIFCVMFHDKALDEQMKNVSETSHATVQGHVSTSLNMLRLTTLCSTNITAVLI